LPFGSLYLLASQRFFLIFFSIPISFLSNRAAKVITFFYLPKNILLFLKIFFLAIFFFLFLLLYQKTGCKDTHFFLYSKFILHFSEKK